MSGMSHETHGRGRGGLGGELQRRRQEPTTCECCSNGVQYRNLVEVAGKRLLARLVPEQRATRIGTDAAAE